MLFTDVSLEQGRRSAAAGSMLASGFIIILGLATLLLLLLYPVKWRSAVDRIAWFVVLLAAPLLVLTPQELLDQYDSWRSVLAADHASKTGFSAWGFLKAWFLFVPGGPRITLTGRRPLMAP